MSPSYPPLAAAATRAAATGAAAATACAPGPRGLLLLLALRRGLSHRDGTTAHGGPGMVRVSEAFKVFLQDRSAVPPIQTGFPRS